VVEEDSIDGEIYDSYFFVGWMKRFTETLCQMYGEKLAKPMTTIVIRPSNIYGPKDDFEPATSHVTAALIRKVAERQSPLEVWGTGDDIRDVIYVDDMIDAMVAAIEAIDGYTAINIARGEAFSVKEILGTLLEIAEYQDAEVVFNSSKPSMIPIRLIDTAKSESILGFRAKTGLKEGLKKAFDWYVATREGVGAAVSEQG
jgi:GDP-L-fucose synthase